MTSDGARAARVDPGPALCRCVVVSAYRDLVAGVMRHPGDVVAVPADRRARLAAAGVIRAAKPRPSELKRVPAKRSRHPRVLHVRPYGYEVGSVYKYAEMFRSVCDLREDVLGSGGRSSIERMIAAEKPDIGLVGGDWWTHWKAFAEAGIPYIVVEHDMWTLRSGAKAGSGAQAMAEREMLEWASAVLFTSEEHQAYCAARYDLPPSEVVHLRPLAEQIAFKPLPRLPGKHLVYAGGVAPWSDRYGAYGYRCYHRVFEAFIAAGWTVHVYPCYLTGAEVFAEYEKLGCVIHEQVPERELARELSRYTAGLQSYADEGCAPAAIAYAKTCRPNKTWSYLAALIPTIGYNTGTCSALYDGRWGVTLDSLSDVRSIDVSTLPTRAELEIIRADQVMERDAEAFSRLLAAVVG